MKASRVKNGTPFAIWLTGLSGAGKSTIGRALKVSFESEGHKVILLDGDDFRVGLCKDLGFTDADRKENIRRASEVAKLLLDAGVSVITAFISPFRDDRELAKGVIGQNRFLEVFVDTPIIECERRDPKGLYARARKFDLINFTGVDSKYEEPLAPDIRITTLTCSVGEAVEILRRVIRTKCGIC